MSVEVLGVCLNNFCASLCFLSQCSLTEVVARDRAVQSDLEVDSAESFFDNFVGVEGHELQPVRQEAVVMITRARQVRWSSYHSWQPALAAVIVPGLLLVDGWLFLDGDDALPFQV